MDNFNRRSALAVGLTAAAALPAIFRTTSAAAQIYRGDEGREIAPGVRSVDVTKRELTIPGYKTISTRDLILQAGTIYRTPSALNDMISICVSGMVQVNQGADRNFTAQPADVWSTGKGLPENLGNPGSTPAIIRVIDLLAG